jgi:hypothetical protein
MDYETEFSTKFTRIIDDYHFCFQTEPVPQKRGKGAQDDKPSKKMKLESAQSVSRGKSSQEAVRSKGKNAAVCMINKDWCLVISIIKGRLNFPPKIPF